LEPIAGDDLEVAVKKNTALIPKKELFKIDFEEINRAVSTFLEIKI
jgi:hypothetical protein